MFETTILYQANREAAEKVIVNQGGTSSGKTYAIMQVLFTRAIEEPRQVITVVGQDIPNLKKGAYRDAKAIYHGSPDLQMWFGKPNESDRVFTCLNGSIIEFTSYADAQDAKSGKRDYLFVNEANGITYDIYQQLYLRTRKVTYIDYNPSARFWVHDKLTGKKGVKLIISDHRHNPFLSAEDHEKIESIADGDLWRVYARGLTGKAKGVIYKNWITVDDMPTTWKKRFGAIDFGFTNDPTAILDIRLSEGELWIDLKSYDVDMDNPMIASLVREMNMAAVHFVADSAEPKSIRELKKLGLSVEGADKGPGSIKNGIAAVKRYKLNVTRRSTFLITELERYRWAVDGAGNPLNVPIDKFNHALDALRYAVYTLLVVNQKAKQKFNY